MGWNIEGQIYTGVYDIIIQTIDSFKKSDKIDNGIAQLIHSLEQQRTEQFLRPLYLNYGHFIYESPYTNTDETDSASLFNQAYAHFIDLVNPQGDYSLTVLDIGELEFINIPRLTVGSLISVYNQDAIHSLPFSYYLGKIEESSGNEKIKWENELIAAYRTIYNDKELPAGYEIEYILDHLYHEHLVVTGISRYLREPSRDSVNVQQNSQYKTILSKLIKSIQ